MNQPSDGEVVVYGLARDGVVRYVGVSACPKLRLARHMRDSKAGSELPVHRWVRKNGPPDMVVLESHSGYVAAYEAERRLIEEYRRRAPSAPPLLNLASGGEGSDGTRGRKLSAAHRAALSRANSGQGKGIPRTLETRQKISATTRGKKRGPVSEAHRRAMSECKIGIPTGPMSEKAKQNLSISLKVAWEHRRASGKGSPSAETRAKMAEGMRRFHRERKHAEA